MKISRVDIGAAKQLTRSMFNSRTLWQLVMFHLVGRWPPNLNVILTNINKHSFQRCPLRLPGFVLDWGSSTIQSYKNETGNASLAEDFVGGRGDYELPPSQDVRRLAGDPTVGSLPLKRPVGRMRTTGRGSRLEAWRELLQKDWNHEKLPVEMEGSKP